MKNTTETNSGNNSPVQVDEIKAALEAQRSREERIANYSLPHNTSVDTRSLEEKCKNHKSILKEIEEAKYEKTEFLNSSGKRSESGKKIYLSRLEKVKTRNEITHLEEVEETIKKDLAQLEKSLTGIYQKDTNNRKRAKAKKYSKKDSYHNRYGSSIEAAIDKAVSGFSDNQLATLRAEVAKADTNVGNALMMKALINAPRFLHTRVVSNPTARDKYLQYFRRNLTGTKGKSRKE